MIHGTRKKNAKTFTITTCPRPGTRRRQAMSDGSQ